MQQIHILDGIQVPYGLTHHPFLYRIESRAFSHSRNLTFRFQCNQCTALVRKVEREGVNDFNINFALMFDVYITPYIYSETQIYSAIMLLTQ